MLRLSSIKNIKSKKSTIVLASTASTPSDYVAYIAIKSSTWVPNTTKDRTNTYTLSADNVSMTNDATRGYVINTMISSASYGIRLESPAVINWIPSYTYTIWLNITGAFNNANYNGIIGDYLASAGSFLLTFDNNGNLNCTHGSSNADMLVGPQFTLMNTWYHIGITYNNSSLLMTMYVNGVSVASKTKSSAWSGFGSSTGGKMSFGFLNYIGSIKSFTGYIDNMRVYGRTLTAAEISAIYTYESTNPTSV